MWLLSDYKDLLSDKSVQWPPQTIIIDTINSLLFTRQNYMDSKLDFGYTLQASQQIVRKSRDFFVLLSYVCGVVRNSVTVLYSRQRIQSPCTSSLYNIDTVVHQNLWIGARTCESSALLSYWFDLLIDLRDVEYKIFFQCFCGSILYCYHFMSTESITIIKCQFIAFGNIVFRIEAYSMISIDL